MNAPLDLVAEAASALLEGRLTDPFAFLGAHGGEGGLIVRSFQPGALSVEVVARDDGRGLGWLQDSGAGLFCGRVSEEVPYRLRIGWPGGDVQETEDPYSFGLVLGDLDLHLFAEGSHWRLAERMGAHPIEMNGVPGVAFSVWAPNARRVSAIGDFNGWDGRRHPMRLRHSVGVWELFVPRLGAGERYKFEIVGCDGGVAQKADPLARATEAPPATASVVAPEMRHDWADEAWMATRGMVQAPDRPISIYEVHPGSWMRPEGQADATLDWDGLAERLPAYAAELGFTHVELLPIMEHPFGGSWGYQPLSMFAPTARFGPPEGFARFVDACHRSGLGVILDWVPAHFPNDAHGLCHFDGTSLYEHADPREGAHPDWGTLIYNLGRREVQGFLIASALYWLETFHVDALRVDAVASMLYRDYSRAAGEWTPNVYGGRENLEAIDFLRRLNGVVAERGRGAVMIAEESTAWPGVTASPEQGGLGFTYKWNMGWMHDTLDYIGKDPVYRRYQHDEMTFGLIYAFSERFVLPLSHDEVVHGKGSLFGRMPGDRWRKFANLRAYFGFMWTHPGKKLLFMGGEIGQPWEWSHDGEIGWDLLKEHDHAGVQRLIRDLNRLYAAEPALHATDIHAAGFEWVVGDDRDNSVFAYLRKSEEATLLVVLNMTPVLREGYRIGVPEPGEWREVLNTDAAIYGGGNQGNGGRAHAAPASSHGQPASMEITLPPLSAVVFKHQV